MKRKMTSISKKLLLLGGLCVILIGVIAMITFSNEKTSNWKKLHEIDEYANIIDSPICKITLRETVTSANWAVFSDEDLVQQWLEFLKDAEVKEIGTSEKDGDKNGGGGSIVEIETEAGKYSLAFIRLSEKVQIEIDGILYDVRSSEDFPFEETFNIAQARYGIRTPWD